MAGERPTVWLRALVVGDADTIAGWGADAEFCRLAGWDAEVSGEVRATRLHGLITSPPPDLLRLGVVSEGALVGYVDLHGSGDRERELGYVIGGRDRWGSGLGAAAARAACAHGFGELGLGRITAEVAVDHHASLAIVAGLGMREVSGASEGHRLFALEPSQLVRP